MLVLGTSKFTDEELSYMWMVDASNNWSCRESMLMWKWCERNIPVIFDFLKFTIDTIPFFSIWMLAICLWFFTDLSTHSAHFFNTKYGSMLLTFKHEIVGIATAQLSRLAIKNLFVQNWYTFAL